MEATPLFLHLVVMKTSLLIIPIILSPLQLIHNTITIEIVIL